MRAPEALSWALVVLATSLITGAIFFDWVSYTPRTKCPECKSYFSFHTVRKWVFEKRTVREGLEEEWKTRTLKRCDKCGYETLGKLTYESVSIE